MFVFSESLDTENNFSFYRKQAIATVRASLNSLRRFKNAAKHLSLSVFAEIVNCQKPLTIFVKTLHHRCLTGFSIPPQQLNMILRA